MTHTKTMTNTSYRTLSRSATVYDADGYVSLRSVQVCDHGDTISIGGTEHRKDALAITPDRIVSTTHGWEVDITSR